MVSVYVVVPVLLSEFFCLVVGSGNVTYLTLDVFRLDLTLANLSPKDGSDEDAHEEEEEGDGQGLGRLLYQTAWDLHVQDRECLVFVAVKLYADHLLHGLQKRLN